MNRIALLLRAPDVTLCGFDHPPDEEHADPTHEVATTHSIAFVDDGAFDVRMGRVRHRFGPGSLFVTTRGLEFTCTHDRAVPTDRCLSVSFGEAAVEDLRRADVPALRPPTARVSARQRWLRHRLRTCVEGDALRLELLAGALFESVAGSDDAPVAAPRPGWQVTLLMQRIDRAVQLAESEYARPLTLEDLAAAAGLSRFHFARAFRELTGVPPHRFLAAVRLRHAAARLAEGASVTRTCFDVGFGSLPHFVTTFGQRFGVTPSRVRRGARVPMIRASLAASAASVDSAR